MDAWTLLNWYSQRDPLLKPSGWYGDKATGFALLSFRDLEEAYKLHLLRTRFGLSMQYLRNALSDARESTNSEHPLVDKKLIVFNYLAWDKPSRGKSPRKMIPLGIPGGKSLCIPEVVDVWGKRIIVNSNGVTQRIFPWRNFSEYDNSRPVSLDPEVMSGRLVVTGTRIPVRVLMKRSVDGESPESIAKDYGIDPEIVVKALIHFDKKTTRAVHPIP
jgi:uncharacterized protein (DUF433 family)